MEIEIVYKGFYCQKESDRDQFPSPFSDEPYFLFAVDDGFKIATTKIGPFEDIDTGDKVPSRLPIDRAIWRSAPTGPDRDIWLVMTAAEDDGGNKLAEDGFKRLFASAGSAAAAALSSGAAAGVAGPIFSAIGGKVANIIIGEDDDHIGTTGLIMTADEMIQLARRRPLFKGDMAIDYNIALQVRHRTEGSYIVYLLVRERNGSRESSAIRLVAIKNQGPGLLWQRWSKDNKNGYVNGAAQDRLFMAYNRYTSSSEEISLEQQGPQTETSFDFFGNFETHLQIGPFRHAEQDSRTLVSYSATEGQVTVRSPDRVGTIGQPKGQGLQTFTRDRTIQIGGGFTQFVPGVFSESARRNRKRDLLFYDASTGKQRMLSLPQRGHRNIRTNFKNWMRHWDLVVPVDLNTGGFTSLLLYSKGDPNDITPKPNAALYAMNAEGDIGMQPIWRSRGWANDWDFICQVSHPSMPLQLLFFSRARRLFQKWQFSDSGQYTLIEQETVAYEVERIVPVYSGTQFPLVDGLLLLN
jgi:hypothetical protein